MIYIFSALYWEAGPFIDRFSLNKIPENICFQEFCDTDKNIRLVITGAGAEAAATAAGWTFAKYPPGECDILLNIGSCAGREPGVYLCHKLTQESTGKSYYPDMIYRHPFLEGELLTMATPVTEAQVGRGKRNMLYDMEGAALYQAGAHFLGPHRMQFIKIVSDGGAAGKIAPKQLVQCMEEQKESVTAYILKLLCITEDMQGPHEERRLWEACTKRLSDALCCSKTMEETLKVFLRYAQLSGKEIERIEQELYGEGKLPCRDKREGKKRFEELKARLL